MQLMAKNVCVGAIQQVITSSVPYRQWLETLTSETAHREPTRTGKNPEIAFLFKFDGIRLFASNIFG